MLYPQGEQYIEQPTTLKSLMKKGIWLYFLLVVFEGALRKWLLPGLATPLLIVRDPIALVLVLIAFQQGFFRFNYYVIIIFVITVIGIFTTIMFAHENIIVAIYGARIWLFHFPLIFVIGKAFNKDDVITLGKVVVWLTIPVVFLIAFQFYSPQSAFINIGVGGDTGGSGFDGALGYFRPSGLFSFTNGNAIFFGFSACFIFYFWIEPGMNKLIVVAATIALLAAIPISISRTLFFHVLISFTFLLIGTLTKPRYMGKMLLGCLVGICLLFFLSKGSFFQDSLEAFTARFESANHNEGGLEGVILDRYLGGLIGAVLEPQYLPFFGNGLGMGTNVGSMLLSGKLVFLIAEGEWGRIIGESGIFLGMFFIMIRLALSLKIVSASYKKLIKGDLLPWMLLSFCLLFLPQGGLAQPTALGFFTLIGGLSLASLRETSQWNIEQTKEPILTESKKGEEVHL